ncbi:MAG: ABC transporter permease, partial [Planctomycetaceae bacterium]
MIWRLLSALDRKLIRDIWQMRGQMVAIISVIACGVGTFVMSLTTQAALSSTQQAYYDRYRFADIFANLKQAPNTLIPRLGEIAGVARVQTRVVRDVILDVPGLREPAAGRLISIPETPQPDLNELHLMSGRYIEPGRDDEVLVTDGFAKTNGYQLGDRVTAILNGRKKPLRIVGTVLSPEYIYTIRLGSLVPDDRRFGILWMGRRALSAAFNMEGAFNDVTMSLMHGASPQQVIEDLDLLLAPYGGLGAHTRQDQISHRFLSDEIKQLARMGTIVPSLFLSVAAFLLNVVLSRQVALQREQIAALKAFGYTNREVGIHYLKLVLLVVILGVLLGCGVGSLLGRHLTGLYALIYKFPLLLFSLPPRIIALALLVSLGAAALGTL